MSTAVGGRSALDLLAQSSSSRLGFGGVNDMAAAAIRPATIPTRRTHLRPDMARLLNRNTRRGTTNTVRDGASRPLLRSRDRRVSNKIPIMASGRRFFGDEWE